jgi:hypothetical protein
VSDRSNEKEDNITRENLKTKIYKFYGPLSVSVLWTEFDILRRVLMVSMLIFARINLNLNMLSVFYTTPINKGNYFIPAYTGCIVMGLISRSCLKGRKALLFYVILGITLILDITVLVLIMVFKNSNINFEWLVLV